MKLNAQQSALLGATAVSVAAWFAPILDVALRPVTYLNTHIHEFCHAVAAVLTGGGATEILVNANGSGLTHITTRFMVIAASAGYVGAAILGAVLIAFGKNEKRARLLLACLAGVFALSLAIWVRGDAAGVFWAIFWVAALAAGAAFLRGKVAVFAVQFVGVQQCLNALLSVVTLLHLSVFQEGTSDATIMSDATGGLVPAIVWALAWGALGVAAVVLALKQAWSSSE